LTVLRKMPRVPNMKKLEHPVDAMDFPRKLDQALRHRGMSQTDLAARVGKPVARVNSWLREPRKKGTQPSFRDVVLASEALCVPLDYWWEPGPIRVPSEEEFIRVKAIAQALRQMGSIRALQALLGLPPAGPDPDAGDGPRGPGDAGPRGPVRPARPVASRSVGPATPPGDEPAKAAPAGPVPARQRGRGARNGTSED
jgi:transcriptional regulator with XRE-family HTH domain